MEFPKSPKQVYGLEEKVRFMERLLVQKHKQKGLSAVAIHGVPGVGKLTLCQVMFNNEKVKARYPLQIWVCLSKQPSDDVAANREEILKRMLICLGLRDEFIDSILNSGAGAA